MGAGASIPETEEEAREQVYTKKQIEDHKVAVVALARENALKSLQRHKQELQKKKREGGTAAEAKGSTREKEPEGKEGKDY